MVQQEKLKFYWEYCTPRLFTAPNFSGELFHQEIKNLKNQLNRNMNKINKLVKIVFLIH